MAKKKTAGPSVSVVGGGIAGMTAALRLAERGYDVALYETKPILGGNMGAHPEGETKWDVYTHMFSNWYHNFWDLVEQDLGLVREEAFDTRTSVRMLRKDGTYLEMKFPNPKDLSSAWANLFSGIAPPADMLLWSYSMLDLLTHPAPHDGVLDEVSMNGFVHSRHYSTEDVAMLHDFILMVIWSAHSYRVSADSYRRFIRYSFRDPYPPTWLLKGNLADKLIDPLTKKLEEAGVTIHLNRKVSKVVLGGSGRVERLEFQAMEWHEADHRPVPLESKPPKPEAPDYVVLAVPPKVLGILASNGEPGSRLVDYLPRLTHARQLRSEPIPVLDLWFKKKIEGLPKEHVSLMGTGSDVSFLDLSQVWDDPEMRGCTVLTVAASDYYGLSAAVTDSTAGKDDAFELVTTLHEYIRDFEPGTHWGDPDSDIDWEKSDFQSNVWAQLFVNEVGADRYRPDPHHAEVANLFFAGDFCKNDVDMATVEAAVTSGLNAARALHAEDPVGPPVPVREHKAYSDATVLALKLLMSPAAYQARTWHSGMEVLKGIAEGRPAREWEDNLTNLWSAPVDYAADVWETMGSLGRAWMKPWYRMAENIGGGSSS